MKPEVPNPLGLCGWVRSAQREMLCGPPGGSATAHSAAQSLLAPGETSQRQDVITVPWAGGWVPRSVSMETKNGKKRNSLLPRSLGTPAGLSFQLHLL